MFPFIVLLYYGFGPFFSPQYAFSSELFKSIAVSFAASALAVMINVVFFTPVAFLTARRENALLDALIDIPASVPHPMVGIALVLLSSPQTALGRVANLLGINLFNSLTGLVLALTIVSAPVYTRAMQNYFKALPREPELFVASLGGSDIKIFWLVVRSSLRGLLSAGLTAMSRAISEFGAVAVIAYYVNFWPFGLAPTASVYIWTSFESYYLSAIPAVATLFLVSLALLAVGRLIR
ncbi:ABC transporter permease subunit [Thermoproteus tenax]|uniref:ABC transporter permease subunit n=1 Tax=Thermoproteus tenax TaxID=2271 RepID=UPI001E3542EC|nr:ABC transporter permease subunit [Thermoproteus tenax]